MAPFKFIDRIFNGLEIQQYGDGYTSRDYTYISDIVDGVVRSIDKPLGYQVFNLGNGRPFLLKNFIKLVEENVGRSAIIKVLPEQPGDVKHTCACIKKARSLLGYSPAVTFEEGISKTVAWYKAAHAAGVFDSDDEDESQGEKGDARSPGGSSLQTVLRMKDRLARNVSDLELSSFVQKAPEPIEKRSSRFVDHSSDFNKAYAALYSKQMDSAVGLTIDDEPDVNISDDKNSSPITENKTPLPTENTVVRGVGSSFRSRLDSDDAGSFVAFGV